MPWTCPRLTWPAGEAERTLEDLNRSLGQEVDADGDEEDPRIELIR